MTNLIFHNESPNFVCPLQPDKPKPFASNSFGKSLPCTRCKGDGYVLSIGYEWVTDDGVKKSVPTMWKPCDSCETKGWFYHPDLVKIISKIKGRKPRTLRSKRPEDSRSYYVWRLARFHGGKDVTLPVLADWEIQGDPHKNVLDQLSEVVAKAYFGSSNVGAARWQQAMYGSHSFPDLPQDLTFI